MTTYHVTKYAATKGILTVTDPDVAFDEPTGVTSIRGQGADKTFVVDKDAFLDLNDARKDAVKRTRRKIAGLIKKEEKLETKIAEWETE